MDLGSAEPHRECAAYVFVLTARPFVGAPRPLGPDDVKLEGKPLDAGTLVYVDTAAPGGFYNGSIAPPMKIDTNGKLDAAPRLTLLGALIEIPTPYIAGRHLLMICKILVAGSVQLQVNKMPPAWIPYAPINWHNRRVKLLQVDTCAHASAESNRCDCCPGRMATVHIGGAAKTV